MDLSSAAQRSRSSAIREILRVTEQPGVLSLAGGLPAPEAFPLAELARASAEVAEAAAFQYSTTEGLAALRERIAAWEHATGSVTEPDGVLVTSGSQQALDLIARTFTDTGTLVAIDDPGYVGAIQVFETAGARFLPIPVDADGMEVAALEAALTGGARIKLCYTVPDGHNPTGTTLSTARRQALAALADRYGFLVVEDGAYRSLGDPRPPVRAFTDRALSVGTVSKTLAPGLRVGWVSGTSDLVTPLARMKQRLDLNTGAFPQRIVLSLVTDEGWWAAHIDRVRHLYTERRLALAAAVRTQLAPLGFALSPADAGMFLWGRFDDIDADSLLAEATRRGVAYVPGSAFAPAQVTTAHRRALRLSFATLPPERLECAVGRLAEAVVASRHATRGTP